MFAATAHAPDRLDAIVAGLHELAARARERPLAHAERVRLVHHLAHLRELIMEVLATSVNVARAADTYTWITAPSDAVVGSAVNADLDPGDAADELCRTITDLAGLLSGRHLCGPPVLAAAS